MTLVIPLTAGGLLASVLCMAPRSLPPEGAQQSPEEATSRPRVVTLEDSDEFVASTTSLMRLGIETKEPNHSLFAPLDPEGGAPFDGSYDWHSSVIAHWALMVRARTTADRELEAWVMDRLSIEALERHGDLLARRSAAALDRAGGDRAGGDRADGEARLRRAMITFPYDEGWFLVMLSEAGKRAEQGAITRLQASVEARLLDALERRPFPENIGIGRKKRKEGVERYCGFYGSSLMLYLQLRWAGPTSDAAKERLDAWRTGVLEPRRADIDAIDRAHGYDFLWAPALLALADQVDGVERTAAYVAPPFEAWPKSVKVATVHVLGMELSRVWPLAGTESGAAPYAERVNSLLAREELWLSDFDACSHWVPQFLFIGEWLRRGRP